MRNEVARGVGLIGLSGSLAVLLAAGCSPGTVNVTCADADGDGAGPECARGPDCDDGNAAVWQLSSGFVDGDGDGYGVGAPVPVCSGEALPAGYAASGGDCDDGNSALHQFLTGYVDADGDGVGAGPALQVCSGASLPAGYAATVAAIPDNANLMGINIAAPLDYEIDYLYANAISVSRTFRSGPDANSATLAPLDAQGWPTVDFSFYVWGSGNHRDGTYALSFAGQATVSGNPIGAVAVSYDPATNTSTGTFRFTSTSGTLALSFTGTRRTASSPLGSGVTAIKLMRPLTPGATQSYPPSRLFADPIKALIAKFRVVRLMDFLATNSNQQVDWSDRPLPSWPSFNRRASAGGYGWQGIGGPWEHAILLMNEVGKDAWISLPVRATDAYVLKVARLFAYGSDGVEPYTSPQANPVYPPLDPSLKLYVEYSNEVWNSAGPFSQFHDNCQAASDELVRTSGNSPLNWDGLWNGTVYNRAAPAGWDYTMCWRNIAKRGVEISDLFRSVFGDAAMMTRVRPVLMTQLGAPTRVLAPATKLMLDYYDNLGGDFVATAQPPSHYFYGAGGSGYYNPAASVTTLDAFFADPGMTPAGFQPALQADAHLAAALGLKRVAYEGGPSLDALGTARDALSAQAVNDSRMTAALVSMHHAWSSNGGDLLVYYRATGDYQWGFTPDVFDLSTPKLLAIDALNAAQRAPLTLGTLVPGSVAGNLPGACARIWNCTPLQAWDNFTADGSKILWASYSFRSSARAPWTVNLTFTSTTSASVAVYVDGRLVGTQSTTGGALSFDAGPVDAGLHGVVVRAAAGSFSLDAVAVAQP